MKWFVQCEQWGKTRKPKGGSQITLKKPEIDALLNIEGAIGKFKFDKQANAKQIIVTTFLCR